MKLRTCILLSIIASALLAAIAVWWAPLNQDEGWYLMAARRVSQGQMPYRDFAFTQAPLFPYVFQFAQPLVENMGLLGGRLFNLFWMGMTYGVLLWSCRKACPKNLILFASLIVISLLGLNAFQAQYTATIKTYTLGGYFLSLGLLGWISYHHGRIRGTLVLTALALAAAASTRITLGIFFIPFGLSLLLERKTKGNRPWILFAVSGFLGLGLFFLPFALQARSAFIFNIYSFHVERLVESVWMLKAGFLSRTALSYLPALFGLFLIIPRWKHWQLGMKSISLGVLLATLVHLFAPFPYDDYQVVLYPALVLLLAIELPQLCPQNLQAKAGAFLLLICLCFTLASPQLQTWFSGKQDLIWFSQKTRSDLSLLRETAKHLKELAPQAKTILTTDAYLAIEANLEIPQGLEMGPFSYFPDLETNKAELYKVVNQQLVLDLLESKRFPLVAISGYGFSISNPMIQPTYEEDLEVIRAQLQKDYRPFSVVENFGQHQTTLRIYVLK